MTISLSTGAARGRRTGTAERGFPGAGSGEAGAELPLDAAYPKCANILIANNPHVFEKRLFSELGEGSELKVLSANNEDHEAERVAGELIAHHFINKTQYKDYAILYRGNHQSRVFEKLLMQNRIPYRISGGTSFFSRPEIKDLLAYLRVLTNPEDDSAFLRIVNTPRREIGPATLQKLGEWANLRNKSLFNASFDMGLEQTLSGRGLEHLQRFTHWLNEIVQLTEREPVNAVRDLIRGIDYESWLFETSPSPKAAEMRMKNVNTLFQWMTEMLEGDELNEPMTLAQVVTRFTLRDMMERGESDEELDQVQLMTLHASKGPSSPCLSGGHGRGLLPHQSSIDENNIEEERRLRGHHRAQKELTAASAVSTASWCVRNAASCWNCRRMMWRGSVRKGDQRRRAGENRANACRRLTCDAGEREEGVMVSSQPQVWPVAKSVARAAEAKRPAKQFTCVKAQLSGVFNAAAGSFRKSSAASAHTTGNGSPAQQLGAQRMRSQPACRQRQMQRIIIRLRRTAGSVSSRRRLEKMIASRSRRLSRSAMRGGTAFCCVSSARSMLPLWFCSRQASIFSVRGETRRSRWRIRYAACCGAAEIDAQANFVD